MYYETMMALSSLSIVDNIKYRKFNMLELRPTCEHCNAALPPDSTDAMICSYECTFCKACVQKLLFNVCPNCGGGFSPRPIRPSKNWKDNNYLAVHPASNKIVYNPVNVTFHNAFSKLLRDIAPEYR